MPQLRNDAVPATNADDAAAEETLAEILARALAKALACTAAGQSGEAEQLYRAIVQARPDHPEANHQLALLAWQGQRPAESLRHFVAALEASPETRQYWLSYVEALHLSGETNTAREVLALGRQHGLAGDDLEALARRVEDSAPQVTHDSATAAVTSNHGRSGNRSSGGGGKPSAREERRLLELFRSGRFREGEKLARALSGRLPSHGFGWKVLGTMLQAQGRNAEALHPLRQAAALLPDDEQVHSNLGLALASVGELHEAEAAQRHAVQARPDFAEAHYNLGNVLCAQGRTQEAEASYRHAVAAQPNFALAHCNLGNTLLSQGRLEEAEVSYQTALALRPELVEAHNNLGDTLRQLGRLREAESAFRRALACRPDFAAAHYNLGNTLSDQGRLDAAEAAWRCALQCQAEFPEALAVLGSALREQGRLDEAESALREALRCRPDFVEAHFHLGAVLRDRNRLAEAVDEWRRALDRRPQFPEALTALGSALKDLGQLQEGEDSLRRALEYRPDFAEAHYNLANNLRQQGRLVEAEAGFRRALAIQPELASALLNLGVTLYELGRYCEAEEACRNALAVNADYPLAHSNLLFWLTHKDTIDPQELFAEHLRFGERFETPLRAVWARHANSRDPERRLHVGFVSGDLCNHSVANFIEPILAQLKGHPRLALHAYSNQAVEDQVTQRLRSYFDHWQRVSGIADPALAEGIRADSIDILIDLSGHTAHHRLLTFARKPAPIQASWIGYPGTTGLQAMDYFVADPYFLPVGEFDDQFTEQIVRLPACAPFLPFVGAPAVGALPALRRNHVTFGSFNRPTKISPSVVALWSKLLTAVPDSRMLVGAMLPDGRIEQLIDAFAANGVTRDRLSFHMRGDMNGYLEQHQQVDICLDTFPYTGGTTAYHALWMGVPTLTLAGRTVPGRPGAAILGQVGLQDFIAHDAAEFVARGVALASDPALLARIRSEARERLRQSAMGQPELIANSLERALRIMWQRWCDDLPPAAFTVGARDLAESR